MIKENAPTLDNFNKYCRNFYGYDVNYGELLFSEYSINGKRIKSQTALYCKLSDMYFREKHNVPNPVKDGWKYSLKNWLAVRYNDKYKPHMRLNEVMQDSDYNEWFQQYWDKLIAEVDL